MNPMLFMALAISFSINISASEPLKPSELTSGLYGTTKKLGVYKSRGPKWVGELKANGWYEGEFVTKQFEDSSENSYDAALSCAEDAGLTMEDYEVDEFELRFDVMAVKDFKKMTDYRNGTRRSRPKTLAYALIPYVEFSFSVAGGSVGNCRWEESGAEFMFFHNDKKEALFLGSKFEYESEVRSPR